MFKNLKIKAKALWNRYRYKGIILMYHRIAETDFDPWQLYVSPVNFAEQMDVLKKHKELLKIKMGEMGLNLAAFRSQPLVAVTFDDGYIDNLTNAKPILEKNEVPGTFYIVSGHIEKRREFWWDELESLVEKSEGLSKLEIEINGTVKKFDLNGNKMKIYELLWKELSLLTYQDKETTLKGIKERLMAADDARKEYLPVDHQELLQLASSKLAEIGAHTVTHPMLSVLNFQDQIQEIKECKSVLEDKIGRKVISFSYPHGNYAQETVRTVKECGFQNACTVHERLLEKNANLFELPRFKVLNWNGDEFEQHLMAWMAHG